MGGRFLKHDNDKNKRSGLRLSSTILWLLWRPRPESNQHLILRRNSFYPLNYGDKQISIAEPTKSALVKLYTVLDKIRTYRQLIIKRLRLQILTSSDPI